MKKIYIIYATIPENIYNRQLKYTLPSTNKDYQWKNGKMYGLYAWTDSKKILNEFFEIRNSGIYTVSKKSCLSDEEYKIFKDNYSMLKLSLNRFYYTSEMNDDECIDIVTTKNEYVISTEYGIETLNEFAFKPSEEISYLLFNKEIIKALDTVGYVDAYNDLYGTDDQAGFTSYQNSFGLTTFGYKKSLPKIENQMNILLFIFGYMFYGGD